MDFSDIVTVKTRTGRTEEFIYDSKPHFVDAKKGLKVPRSIAELGLNQHALRWDSGTGLVVESKLFIEDDSNLPKEPISDAEVEEIKQTDGLGEDSILVDGQSVKKKRINLKPKKEDYSANNL